MRKWMKQEILDFINSLWRAHKEIETALKQRNIDLAKKMLGECQEFAIELGNCIEKSEGEGHITVSYIEEYCEILFTIHERLSINATNRKNVLKSLKNQLIKIENSVKNDIVIKKEIVFFPYNASMWDSLESIYLEEKKDPQKDIYCVPIPYYDLNPNGSFGKMHYDGSEYPKNIEVIDWKTYCFEERKPDIIYIHNPYDNYNLVTSVHPRFYSGNLKKSTEKLIYIPYFVLDEIEPEDQVSIDNMKHFIWLPGVINADQVIVQSEKMRQIYIEEYKKQIRANGLKEEYLDKSFLEQKFLSMRSPKISRIINIRKEEIEIPKKWLKILEKPDEGRKKIIFYNTGVTSLLKFNEEWLDKIEDTLEIFKNNQDKVALLWRPHPLIENTMKAMRPILLNRYLEIKDTYIKEGWGIFDNTSEVDRAVVLCDSYYGDRSSVTELCRKLCKPVIIQNVSMGKEQILNRFSQNHMQILIEDAVWQQKKIWFCAENFNGLFLMNIDTRQISLEGRFPCEPYDGVRLFASMKLVNEKIYFVPFSAKSIAVFDTQERQFSTIQLDESLIACKRGNPLFMGVERYNEYLFLLPVYAGAIVRLNTENNEIEYINKWKSQVKDLVFDTKEAYFRKQAYIKEAQLIVPFCNANAVLELDCVTMNSTVYCLGSELRGYSGICYDGKSFWLSPRKTGELVKWNTETGVVGVIKNTFNTVGLLYYNNTVMLFPAMGEKNISNSCKNDILVLKEQYNVVREEIDYFLYYQPDLGKLTIFDKINGREIVVRTMINNEDFDIRRLVKETNCIKIEKDEINILQLIKTRT